MQRTLKYTTAGAFQQKVQQARPKKGAAKGVLASTALTKRLYLVREFVNVKIQTGII